jgi:hypothetical protein
MPADNRGTDAVWGWIVARRCPDNGVNDNGSMTAIRVGSAVKAPPVSAHRLPSAFLTKRIALGATDWTCLDVDTMPPS